jgi:hypothetical protein
MAVEVKLNCRRQVLFFVNLCVLCGLGLSDQ